LEYADTEGNSNQTFPFGISRINLTAQAFSTFEN